MLVLTSQLSSLIPTRPGRGWPQASKQRLTKHIGGAHKLDDLRQGGAQVVALDLLLQSGGAQQRVLHVQGCQAEAPTFHLTHQSHQALQACPQRCACANQATLLATL